MARINKFHTPNLGLIIYDEVDSGEITEREKFVDQFSNRGSNLIVIDDEIGRLKKKTIFSQNQPVPDSQDEGDIWNEILD